MNLKNKEDRINTKPYLGNFYQVGGTRPYTLTDGSSNGCRCIDVRTGSGFDYTVVCDRGLDISLASYRGTNLVHLTPNAEANPAFYDPWGAEWLRTFSGGLLTTCGPTYLGNPCEDEDEMLGQHGRFSAIPARQVCDLTDFENGTIEITGKLYDCYTFGHKVCIHRKIRSLFGESKVIIEDQVCNEGSRSVPLNMLYHVNFGYPLLSETTTVHIPSETCRGYDEDSERRLCERFTIKAPDGANSEKNYLHTFSQEQVTAWICNTALDEELAVYLKFSSHQLPYLTQWVLEDEKDYVLAIEPGNVPCESRNVLRRDNLLPELALGESKSFCLEIGVVSGKEEILRAMGK